MKIRIANYQTYLVLRSLGTGPLLCGFCRAENEIGNFCASDFRFSSVTAPVCKTVAWATGIFLRTLFYVVYCVCYTFKDFFYVCSCPATVDPAFRLWMFRFSTLAIEIVCTFSLVPDRILFWQSASRGLLTFNT
jgi:hypothetical protein